MAKKTTNKSAEQKLDQTIETTIKSISNQGKLAAKANNLSLEKTNLSRQAAKDQAKLDAEKLQAEMDQLNAKLEDVQTDLFAKNQAEEGAGDVLVAAVDDKSTVTDVAGSSAAGGSAAGGVSWAMVGLGALGVAGVAAAAGGGGGGGGGGSAPAVPTDQIFTFDQDGERSYTLGKNSSVDTDTLIEETDYEIITTSGMRSNSDTVFVDSAESPGNYFVMYDAFSSDAAVLGNLEVAGEEFGGVFIDANIDSSFLVEGSTLIESSQGDVIFLGEDNVGSSISMGDLTLIAASELDIFNNGSSAVDPNLTRLAGIEDSDIDTSSVYVGLSYEGDLVTLQELEDYLASGSGQVVRNVQDIIEFSTFSDLSTNLTSLSENLVLVPVYAYDVDITDASVIYYVLTPVDGLDIDSSVYDALTIAAGPLTIVDENDNEASIQDALYSQYEIDSSADARFSLDDNIDTDVNIGNISVTAGEDATAIIYGTVRAGAGDVTEIVTGDIALTGGEDAFFDVDNNYVDGRNSALEISGGSVDVVANVDAYFDIENNFTNNQFTSLNLTFGSVNMASEYSELSIYNNYTNDSNSSLSVGLGDVSIVSTDDTYFDLDYNGTYNQYDSDGSTFSGIVGAVNITAGDDADLSINENYAYGLNSTVDLTVGSITVASGEDASVDINYNDANYYNSVVNINVSDINLTAGIDVDGEDTNIDIRGNETYGEDSAINITTGNLISNATGNAELDIDENLAKGDYSNINVVVGTVNLQGNDRADLTIDDNEVGEDSSYYPASLGQSINIDVSDVTLTSDIIVDMDIDDNQVFGEDASLSINVSNINITSGEDAYFGIDDNDIEDEYWTPERSTLNVSVGNIQMSAVDYATVDIEDNDNYGFDSDISFTVGNVEISSGDRANFDIDDNDINTDDSSMTVTVGNVTITAVNDIDFDLEGNDGYDESTLSVINVGNVSLSTTNTSDLNEVYGQDISFSVEDQTYATVNVASVTLTTASDLSDIYFDVTNNDNSTVDLGNVQINAGEDANVLLGFTPKYSYFGEDNDNSTITINNFDINAMEDAYVTLNGEDSTVSIDQLNVSAVDYADVYIESWDTNNFQISDVNITANDIDLNISGEYNVGNTDTGWDLELGKITLSGETADVYFEVSSAVKGIDNDDDIYVDVTQMGSAYIDTVETYSNLDIGFGEDDYSFDFADIRGMTMEIGNGDFYYNTELRDDNFNNNDYVYTTNNWQETFYFSDLLSGEIVIGGFSATDNVNNPSDILVFDEASGVTIDNMVFQQDGDDLIIGFTDTGSSAPNGTIRLLDFQWEYAIDFVAELEDQIYFGDLNTAVRYDFIV